MECVGLLRPVFLPLQQPYCNNSTSTSSPEPQSPDSGFSSDDSSTSSPFERQKSFSGRLRSALRRLPSDPSDCPKKVRFADAIVHQLADDSEDEEPKPQVRPVKRTQLAVSLPNFQFCSESEYYQKARQSGVAVTALRTCGNSLLVQIAVHNFAFDKDVSLRWSENGWKDTEEQSAAYSHPASGSEDVDVFSASLALPAQEGQFELCVRFRSNGRECWDNNASGNYHIVWSHR